MTRLISTLVLSVVALVTASAQDRREGALNPGDAAPDFSLTPQGGGRPVALSSFKGKPVAVVFGSYT